MERTRLGKLTPIGCSSLICFMLACSTDGGSTDASATEEDAAVHDVASTDVVFPVDVATFTDLGEPSATGSACTTSATLQGTCAEGYICFPSVPGGYCTQFCGSAACPWDAACVQSSSAGEFCAKSCESDSECREEEGYLCDGDWGACMIAGVLSPVLKECTSAPALARKTFGKVSQLSTASGPGLYHTETTAALDANGNISAVFIARNQLGEDSGLGVSTHKADGTVDGDRTLLGSSKEIFDPWLASDRGGKMYLAYYGHDGFDVNGVIGMMSSVDGVSWSTEQVVHHLDDCPGNPAGCLDKSMIAIGPQKGDLAKDAIYVFYYATPKSSLRVRRSLDGGKTFSLPVSVGSGLYGDAEVSSDGNLHVTYITGTAGPSGFGDLNTWVEYVSSNDGAQTFTSAKRVSSTTEPVPGRFSNPQLVGNPANGSVHVVYPSGASDGAWDIRLATSTDGGGTWNRIKVNDDDHCANHMLPAMVLEPSEGTLHVAWLENRNGQGQVAYTTCAKDGKSCAANERISDKPFADYSLVRHSPKWVGDYFSLVMDEQRKAVHAIWAQPVSENGQVRARVFHAKAAIAKTP